MISSILNCKETHGYEKHLRAIVKEINGKPITNIHDAVRAMEGNTEKRHVISLASKSKIVIPNMSAEEHAKLLKRNHITQDRSTDLERMPVAETKDSSSMSVPKKSELYVEEMELTQSGMHAVFVQMGYPDMMSGSIYDGKPTLNLDALNHQGFMPILADVGQKRISGHWIMLIHGHDNEYFIFDPVGAVSGKNYVDALASQLPRGARLSVIPNEVGFNRGLCGYWVASIGLRAHAALTTLSSLAMLGQAITQEMQAELANNGFMKIITWLHSITEKFTGGPSVKPIDAKELRQASETGPQRRVEVTPIQPHSSSERRQKHKGRRVVESDDEVDIDLMDEETAIKTFGLTMSDMPGLKRYEQTLNAMEERYKSLPDEDDDDVDFTNLGGSGDDDYEEETESDDHSMDLDDSEPEEMVQIAKSHHPKLQRHGFFQPSSRGMALDMDNVKQFKFK